MSDDEFMFETLLRMAEWPGLNAGTVVGLQGKTVKSADRDDVLRWAAAELTRLRAGRSAAATLYAAVGKFGMTRVCMAFDTWEECAKFANGEVPVVPLYTAPPEATP